MPVCININRYPNNYIGRLSYSHRRGRKSFNLLEFHIQNRRVRKDHRRTLIFPRVVKSQKEKSCASNLQKSVPGKSLSLRNQTQRKRKEKEEKAIKYCKEP